MGGSYAEAESGYNEFQRREQVGMASIDLVASGLAALLGGVGMDEPVRATNEKMQTFADIILTDIDSKWTPEKATSNLPDKQFLLGKKFYEGNGVPRNKEMASYWLNKSAQGGSRDAMQYLANIN